VLVAWTSIKKKENKRGVKLLLFHEKHDRGEGELCCSSPATPTTTHSERERERREWRPASGDVECAAKPRPRPWQKAREREEEWETEKESKGGACLAGNGDNGGRRWESSVGLSPATATSHTKIFNLGAKVSALAGQVGCGSNSATWAYVCCWLG